MSCCLRYFFFNATATTEIYTYWHALSLHDALPIFGPFFARVGEVGYQPVVIAAVDDRRVIVVRQQPQLRSEEHTSELQSLMRTSYAVFCLKKKESIQNKSRHCASRPLCPCLHRCHQQTYPPTRQEVEPI